MSTDVSENDTVEEAVEGLDIPGRDDLTAYPLDDVMVRKETRTVGEVIKRIEKGRYVMAPDFQRDFVWPTDKQSKLIESCLMRIPLPVLYVAEGEDGRVAVVDGLQRLTTFMRFLSNGFKLTGLAKDHPLLNLKFSDLPLNLQERIEDTQLTLYILDKSAPDVARLDIFERVNGGVPLTRQQMRNAIYTGKSTEFLRKMSKSKEFLKATGRSLNTKTMRDREAINRFTAFYVLGWKAYTNGDMDEFLGEALSRVNKFTEEQITNLETVFLQSMEINYALFDRHSFRKSILAKKRYADRSVINISLFDVMSVALAKVSTENANSHGQEIYSKTVELLQDANFVESITYSTNSTVQVRSRFRILANTMNRITE